MLNDKGFDLWADGYDKSVGISDEGNTYPFAGYKKVLGYIFQAVMEKQSPTVLDIGFGTGTLTTKLYENGCCVYGQDFSERMIELAASKMPNAHLYQGDFSNDKFYLEVQQMHFYKKKVHFPDAQYPHW